MTDPNDNHRISVVRVTKEMHQKLRIHRTLTGESIQSLIERLINEWFEKEGKGEREAFKRKL
jgi:hypothetical protein